MPEDRRYRNAQINEAPDPLDPRPRIGRYARDGLASIDPDDRNIRDLAGREAGESLQSWPRRQPPETPAAISRPEGSVARAVVGGGV